MSHSTNVGPAAPRRTGLLASLALVLTLVLGLAAPNANAKPAANAISVVPTITSLSFVNGQLMASGTATATVKGGKTYTAPFSNVPVTLTVPPGQQLATCPVLDLTLGPIHLDLLGLVVDTSPICLTITAQQGGGLLGDLLCQIGGLLNQGLPLQQVLGLLTDLNGQLIDLNTVLGQLTNLLNGVLGQLNTATLTSVTPSTLQHTCAILHLELGPVDLTLLGLNVHLDNCAGQAVTVDITAETGRGNFLGNLLCELLDGGLLSPGATLQDVINGLLALLQL